MKLEREQQLQDHIPEFSFRHKVGAGIIVICARAGGSAGSSAALVERHTAVDIIFACYCETLFVEVSDPSTPSNRT